MYLEFFDGAYIKMGPPRVSPLFKMQLQKTIFHEEEGGLCGLKVKIFSKLWKKNISTCNKLKIVEAWSSKSFSGEALVKKINDTPEILLGLANAGRREWGDAHKSDQKIENYIVKQGFPWIFSGLP